MFETYLLPVRTAVTMFPLLALLVMLPVAVISYRRRGRAGGWTALVFYCFLFYLLAAFLQTVIPLPADPTGYCATTSYASTPQLRPLNFIDVVATRTQRSGFLNPATWSTALNVVLLAPLTFFLRYLAGTRFLPAVALGFGTSLFFELTQLTGVWFIYPCAYRLFSVDDLILNTTGAALGWLVAGPLIRLLPHLNAARDRRRYAKRVTASRRVLALLTDTITFGVLTLIVVGLIKLFGGPASVRSPAIAAVAVLYFLLVPVQTGSTLGKLAMLLKIERTDGRRAGPFSLLARNGMLFSPLWLLWLALEIDHWDVFGEPQQLLIPVGLLVSVLVVGVWTPLAVFFGDEPAPYERLTRTHNVAIVSTQKSATS